jgi:hypothetical protein
VSDTRLTIPRGRAGPRRQRSDPAAKLFADPVGPGPQTSPREP